MVIKRKNVRGLSQLWSDLFQMVGMDSLCEAPAMLGAVLGSQFEQCLSEKSPTYIYIYILIQRDFLYLS